MVLVVLRAWRQAVDIATMRWGVPTHVVSTAQPQVLLTVSLAKLQTSTGTMAAVLTHVLSKELVTTAVSRFRLVVGAKHLTNALALPSPLPAPTSETHQAILKRVPPSWNAIRYTTVETVWRIQRRTVVGVRTACV
eukprot:TRINITY_DN5041_c0_g1_i1.p3 TRINITY_DN5041_c0_g1~~TRINITY_DN5041_c0_g1_i1.p3  ORF type:complete len:136 (+),score=2.62 TRINITY_DN5041_c0_g1_i1:149-556(+)